MQVGRVFYEDTNPVKLCNPAPIVESNDPMRITHLLGHAMFATSNDPPMLSPNL